MAGRQAGREGDLLEERQGKDTFIDPPEQQGMADTLSTALRTAGAAAKILQSCIQLPDRENKRCPPPSPSQFGSHPVHQM